MVPSGAIPFLILRVGGVRVRRGWSGTGLACNCIPVAVRACVCGRDASGVGHDGDGSQRCERLQWPFLLNNEIIMFQTLNRIALGAALVTGSALAQQNCQVVPATAPPAGLIGIQAEVCGSNFSGGVSLVGYTVSYGGFQFGNGTIASVVSSGAQSVLYTYAPLKFTVTPQFAWGAWCAGLGTVTFTVQV